MAFKKKTWKDRLSEFPGRRLLTIISNSVNQMVVDVARHEGEVPQEGDAFNQANMNDLEQRIGDAFAEQPEWLYDEFGKIVAYKTKAGADTEFPFSSNKSNVIDAKFVTNGTNLLEIWPDLFDFNINTYVVCSHGEVGSRIVQATVGGLAYSGNMSVSVSINKQTGILTISNPGFYQASAYVELSGLLNVSGAVVIISKKE